MTKEERKRVIERLEAISECNYKSLHSECLMDCENCGLGYMIGTNEEYAETISFALTVLKQEPCEDTVSRKELVEWLEHIQPKDGKELGVLFEVREHVKQMQPVTPAREHGEWMLEYDSPIATFYRCSVCGRKLTLLKGYKHLNLNDYPYCHCGADMRKEQK